MLRSLHEHLDQLFGYTYWTTSLAEICKYSEDSLFLKGMGIYYQITDGISTRMNFSLTFLRRVWGFSQHASIEGYFGHPNFCLFGRHILECCLFVLQTLHYSIIWGIIVFVDLFYVDNICTGHRWHLCLEETYGCYTYKFLAYMKDGLWQEFLF